MLKISSEKDTEKIIKGKIILVALNEVQKKNEYKNNKRKMIALIADECKERM